MVKQENGGDINGKAKKEKQSMGKNIFRYFFIISIDSFIL